MNDWGVVIGDNFKTVSGRKSIAPHSLTAQLATRLCALGPPLPTVSEPADQSNIDGRYDTVLLGSDRLPCWPHLHEGVENQPLIWVLTFMHNIY